MRRGKAKETQGPCIEASETNGIISKQANKKNHKTE